MGEDIKRRMIMWFNKGMCSKWLVYVCDRCYKGI